MTNTRVQALEAALVAILELLNRAQLGHRAAIRRIIKEALPQDDDQNGRGHERESRFTREREQPEPGKVYRLTGGSDEPSIARGDALSDCEVDQ
jgi:hypothetical protein